LLRPGVGRLTTTTDKAQRHDWRRARVMSRVDELLAQVVDVLLQGHILRFYVLGMAS
jgi:hypothetical protein